MRVTSLKVQAFRSLIEIPRMEFDAINVFVGANNVGKSSILRSLYHMQLGSPANLDDVSAGSTKATIEIGLADVDHSGHWSELQLGHVIDVCTLEVTIGPHGGLSHRLRYNLNHVGEPQSHTDVRPLPNIEPRHFIVPYLSSRKTSVYAETVNLQETMNVTGSLSSLAAKLARIANPGFPKHEAYANACTSILGFLVTPVLTPNGLRPGAYLPDASAVPIDRMGDGIAHIVGLLSSLITSERKLFLIEELENDLHPTALKDMLELIVQSSESNQFFISTHSNIVVRHLGSSPGCRVFKVSSDGPRWPVKATVQTVDRTPTARLEVLRDLGYAFSDFDLWDGWLILEESSAERIIREYLVPWFAPKLARVRTLSANGAGRVEPTFDDFNRLVLFTHLEEAYKDAAWVRVDDDVAGRSVVDQLRQKYHTWSADRFASFSQDAFERYYPRAFHKNVEKALATPDAQLRRKEKARLLAEVLAWLDEDDARGKAALEESAWDVIQDLRRIQEQLPPRTART